MADATVQIGFNLSGQGVVVQGFSKMAQSVDDLGKKTKEVFKGVGGQTQTALVNSTKLVTTAIEETTKATGRARDAFGRFISSGEGVTSGLGRTSKAAGETASRFSGLTGAFNGAEGGANSLANSFSRLIQIGAGLYLIRQAIGAFTGFTKANSEVETLTLQFSTLLGSAGAAKSRMKDLYAFAAKTPFELGEVAKASKLLEVLTRGALSGQNSLRMVGDAAAVSGGGFENTAMWVGRLYNQLQNNKALDEAGMRLTELGLLTGDTRSKLEAMVKAGTASTEGWALFTKELERTKGGMETLSHSTVGLTSTFKDNMKQFLLYIGEGGAMSAFKAQLEQLNKKFTSGDGDLKRFGETIGKLMGDGINKLSAAMRALLPVLEFVANNFQAIIAVGETLFVMYAVTKLVAITNAIRGIGMALQFAAASNPILAAITVALGVSVLAYQSYSKQQEGLDKMAFWSSEEGRIKSANIEIQKNVDLTKSVAEARKRVLRDMGQTEGSASPFPTVAFSPGKGPAKVHTPRAALSQEDKDELKKIQAETTKLTLEAKYDGFQLEKALEDMRHTDEVGRHAGKDALIEAEAKRHTAEMAKIIKGQTEETVRFAEETAAGVERANAKKSEADMVAARKNLAIKQAAKKKIEDETTKNLQLQTEYTSRSKALDEQVSSSKTALANEAVSVFSKLTGASKMAFFAQKAIAATSIVLNSLMAQSAALAPPPIGVGPVFGLALVAKLQTLMGFQLAGVAAQSIQGFDDGGIVQGAYTTGDRIPIRANAKEMMMTQGQQASLWSFIKGGSQGNSAGGNNVSVTYAPVYPSGADSYGPSFTEAARRDKVEFGRFMEKELKAKGYVN